MELVRCTLARVMNSHRDRFGAAIRALGKSGQDKAQKWSVEISTVRLYKASW